MCPSPCRPASDLTLVLCARGGRRSAARPAGRRARAARGPAERAASAAYVALAALILAALAAAVRLSSSHDGPGGALSYLWGELSGGGAVGSTDHLTQLSTNLRSRWWGEAWDAFSAHPLHRATGPTRSRRSTGSHAPTSSRPARSIPPPCTCSPGSGCWERSPRLIALGAGAACLACRHAPARSRALRRAGARGRRRGVRAAQPDRLGVEADRADGPGLSRCPCSSPVPRAAAPSCAPRRRSLAIAAAVGVRARHHPGGAAGPRATTRSTGPTASTSRDASTRRAWRPTSPRPSTAGRWTAQLQRASLLQALGRPADARRAVDRAIALAPKDSRRLARRWRATSATAGTTAAGSASLARARALAGHDTVFDGSDADVIAASDACAP